MQLESLQAVDRMVEAVINALAAAGEINQTVILFTSDNGLSWGEHRFLDDKVCVYEECSKVPLWINTPGIAARTDDNLVENIDIAPTIADFAGVPAPSSVNGMSFVDLLLNSQASWRTELLLEGWGHHSGLTNLHGFQGVRTQHYVYAEYYNGDQELYDLLLDPFQLNNVANNPSYAAIKSQLQSLLNNLRNQ
jgi:arylsulfatase A-like enzyme